MCVNIFPSIDASVTTATQCQEGFKSNGHTVNTHTPTHMCFHPHKHTHSEPGVLLICLYVVMYSCCPVLFRGRLVKREQVRRMQVIAHWFHDYILLSQIQMKRKGWAEEASQQSGRELSEVCWKSTSREEHLIFHSFFKLICDFKMSQRDKDWTQYGQSGRVGGTEAGVNTVRLMRDMGNRWAGGCEWVTAGLEGVAGCQVTETGGKVYGRVDKCQLKISSGQNNIHCI